LLAEQSFFSRVMYFCIFGRETAGLSAEQLALFPNEQRIRLPMLAGQRSLNLSNAVAICVF